MEIDNEEEEFEHYYEGSKAVAYAIHILLREHQKPTQIVALAIAAGLSFQGMKEDQEETREMFNKVIDLVQEGEQ